jgi:HlyD family secretion protein
MRNNLRRIIPLIIALGLIGYGGYHVLNERAQAQNPVLKGSGSIEATEITVAAEGAGRVKDVLVSEGDAVKAGQPLVQFDDAILEAQRAQAAAALAAARGNQAASQAQLSAAQANLEQLRAGPRPQEIEAEQQAVAAAQGRVSAAEGQLAQSQGAQQAAQAARAQAVARFAQLKQGARPEQIQAAAVAYEQAQAALRAAQASYDQIAGNPDAARRPQAVALEQATLALQAVKANYEGVLKGATTPELDQARAGINQAVAGIVQASAVVSQTEAALTIARASLDAEKARLDLLQAGARPEQIKAAEAQVAAAKAMTEAAAGQVAAAEASVALFDTQIGRLLIAAPSEGVVLARAVEPGEVAMPGGALLTLGDLGRLSLTVYLPEDRYGAVRLGDRARVTVDSYAGESFSGSVQRVADKAEFTPRNVQTPAGRRTTVFAVKLALDNPEGKLKPGMPADVVFGP